MENAYTLLCIFIVFISTIPIGIFLAVLKSKLFSPIHTQVNKITPSDYFSKKYLLTRTEQKFFHGLINHIDPSHYIAAQVNLSDLVIPTNKGNRKIALMNRIARKHIDFVLIEKETSKIVLAIELDDKYHNSQKARYRDSVKDAALKSAEIPLKRVYASREYDFTFLDKL